MIVAFSQIYCLKNYFWAINSCVRVRRRWQQIGECVSWTKFYPPSCYFISWCKFSREYYAWSKDFSVIMLHFILWVPSKSVRHYIFQALTKAGIYYCLNIDTLRSISFCLILWSGGDEQSKYSLWSNPRFSSSQLRDLWRTNDPLLTVVWSRLDLVLKRIYSWSIYII